jgi:hypothetical protein
VRDTEIVFHRHLALVLVVLGSSLACKSEESATKPETKPEAARDREPERGPKPEAGPTPHVEPESAATPSVADDAERADKLADLDALCKAVDHDYVDGTLSDYYRDIEPRTDWGKAQRDAGNQSIQPGRLLEKAVAELSPDAKDPALEHCRKLLDYLDDVE